MSKKKSKEKVIKAWMYIWTDGERKIILKKLKTSDFQSLGLVEIPVIITQLKPKTKRK